MGSSTSRTNPAESISSSKIVAEAYLYVCQTSSQGVYNNQIVSVNCDDNVVNSACTDCISLMYNLGTQRNLSESEIKKNIEDNCNIACNCNLSNVNLKQIISVDFSIFQESKSAETFSTAIKNVLFNKVYQENGALSTNNMVQNIDKISTELYQRMNTSSFQNAIQSLSNMQFLQVKYGTASYVEMQQAINVISEILQSSVQTSDIINNLQTEIISASSQMIKAGFNELIVIIILIIAIVFVIAIFGFVINLFLQLYAIIAI